MSLHVSESFADILIEFPVLLHVREIINLQFLEDLINFVLLL